MVALGPAVSRGGGYPMTAISVFDETNLGTLAGAGGSITPPSEHLPRVVLAHIPIPMSARAGTLLGVLALYIR